MKLTGNDVEEVLEQALENVFTDNLKQKVGGMIQVSGVRFRYRAGAGRGHRLGEVQTSNGRLDRGRTYSVATNSMLANGGHHHRAFSGGADLAEHGSQYETIKQWITRNSPVRTPPLGRIAPMQT